ncbi:DUF397 domain-containing protein (plasmid) [Nocardiopsis eucommiae]|uniref:DUF397 domain-containing protein n=1 Tax=Nocardiopsis eucommiae TaxID=2831970 RepID=A0A975LDX0_9ACTN|nr:DUF397 domain-containing protein [Nocardiopsis eucommiae]
MPETSHLNFRKSSYSGGQTQDCVEVADVPGASAVRDTQNRDAGHLLFPGAEWAALLKTAPHK